MTTIRNYTTLKRYVAYMIKDKGLTKGLDGCYESDELVNCEKGFYARGNDVANAAKAQAFYIQKYGKKELLNVHDRLHEKYDFTKTQEILGNDIFDGLGFLEEH